MKQFITDVISCVERDFLALVSSNRFNVLNRNHVSPRTRLNKFSNGFHARRTFVSKGAKIVYTNAF